jgi:lipoprotein-anchoring transpeptidase ErfK/SrfK
VTSAAIALLGLLAGPGVQSAPASPQPPAKPGATAPAPVADPQALPKGVEGLALQVALDRAGFSPGALDGKAGANTKKALEAYRKSRGGDPPVAEAVTRYRLTDQDVAGPFEPDIPSDLVEQAKLKALSYRNPLEAMAERFHATPGLLEELNPTATFTAGEEIVVPNVDPMLLPTVPPKAAEKATAAEKKAQAAAAAKANKAQPDVTVVVSKASGALTVTGADGKLLMYAPVTTGSENDPLPIGSWKVNGVGLYPEFRYNPDLFWDADPAHTKALIPAGPNNPVGLVWIDITKEHYGLHGTPEPNTVGRAESHGCVRLTNWDALRLASLVKPGTPVEFKP